MSSWRLIGATCRGASHVLSDRPNDDRFATAVLAEQVALSVVADGAGSSALGGIGAEAAVRAVSEFFDRAEPDRLRSPDQWQGLLWESLEAARYRVEQEARAAETELNALATTLHIVLASTQAIGRLQIGDGGAVGAVGENLLLLTARSDSEFVNETHFITGPNFRARATVKVLTGLPIAGVAVFSDGLTPLCVNMSSWTPHEGFFCPLFNYLRSAVNTEDAWSALVSLLDSSEAHRRTDDDRTLVVALPLP